MNDTDAVSCLLCLQADEYGSMIKVCVPPGRIPPSPEKVVCRRCLNALNGAVDEELDSIYGRKLPLAESEAGDHADSRPTGDPGRAEWDSHLPERADESVVEVDGSEPENATGSSSKN